MRRLFAISFLFFGLTFFARALIAVASNTPTITTLAPFPTAAELPFLGAQPVESDVPRPQSGAPKTAGGERFRDDLDTDLDIPSDSKSESGEPSPKSLPDVRPSVTARQSALDGTTIIVGSNDTIDILAKRYNVSSAKILQANGYKGPRALSPGQELIIPRHTEPRESVGHVKLTAARPESKKTKIGTGKPKSPGLITSRDGGLTGRVFAAEVPRRATADWTPYSLALASSTPAPGRTPIKALANAITADDECRNRMRKLGVVYSEKCVDISDIVKDLAVGTYSFNKPIKAYVDDPFHLTLVLKTAERQEVVSYFAGLAGTVTSREGKFAQSIVATLRADDLTVAPSDPQARTATSQEAVAWDWTITPRSEGSKTLVIEVVANILVGKDQHPVSVRTLREPITIEVSYLQKVKTYVAAVNGYVLAATGTIAAVAGAVGFVPPFRRFVSNIWFRRKEQPRYGR
jgi:LysM repeat protein